LPSPSSGRRFAACRGYGPGARCGAGGWSWTSWCYHAKWSSQSAGRWCTGCGRS
jgi:hypothetical protein